MLGRACLVALVLICAPAAAGATAKGAGSVKACTPRQQTAGGHTAIAYCGPATATITIAGRTYRFRHGACVQSATVGALQVSIGTLVRGAAGNAGRPFVSLLIARSPSESEAFEADWRGHQLFGDSVIAQNSNLLSHGTFVSVLGAAFAGSWNCHGAVFAGP
ncbi:MAG TPA: hypothetical protein VID68_13330 [Solirubrobacteraceae bacterium]